MVAPDNSKAKPEFLPAHRAAPPIETEQWKGALI
jgi:hypothetical protein